MRGGLAELPQIPAGVQSGAEGGTLSA